MSSKQLRIVAIVLLVLAGVLALLAWQVARRAAEPRAMPIAASAPAPSYPVVVATRPLEAGKPIAADALRIAQLPIDPAGAHRKVEALAGRVPVVDVGANVPVLDSHLNAGLAGQVPPGHRAVAVAVDEVIGVGHRVRPGDFVDVFVVLPRDSQEIGDSQARLLLSRLRVLAYGAQAVDESGDGGAARHEGARTAVLAVPLPQVVALTMAQQAGRLMLALRNPAEGAPGGKPTVAAVRANAAGAAGVAGVAGEQTGSVLLRQLAATPAQTAAPVLAVPRPRVPSRDTAQALPTGIEVIRAGKRVLE